MNDNDIYYQILGVEASASKEEIKQAYKDLLNVWNPERFADDPSLQQKAREKIKEIDDAYEKLILHSAKNGSNASPSQDRSSSNYENSDEDSAQFRERFFHYAGFWSRFVANLIDGVILGVIDLLIIMSIAVIMEVNKREPTPIGSIFFFIIPYLFLPWLYASLLESSSKQATLGKMALGIIVTDLSGNRVSFSRANGRYWGKILSSLILMIGFIMAGFTEKKQALHDIMAGCLVLKKTD